MCLHVAVSNHRNKHQPNAIYLMPQQLFPIGFDRQCIVTFIGRGNTMDRPP
jgi:hypothetical protein